jgi:hypothetical protein
MSEPLRTYNFLPWLQQGLGRRVGTIDPIGANPNPPVERASLAIDFDVNGAPVGNTVLLIGPGDVIGINPQAIVKTEPHNWITNFEPNFLPYVEFSDEGLPWRHTPATANAEHRLRPWLVLVVVAEDEFIDAGAAQPSADKTGPLVPLVEITGDSSQIFPPADQAWAWAHVHVSQDISGDGTLNSSQTVDALETLIGQNPDLASSRLLCPRKLRENTAYHAFVLPAFEIGRRAGLGQPTTGVDNLAPSWGSGQKQFPVLYRWFFRTADRGDFEYLAGLLQPRVIPAEVGIRDMDVQRPDFGVRGMSSPPVMGLEGALKKPGAVARPVEWPPAQTPALLEDLEAKVNLAADLLENPPAGGHPDPVVTLPLYGRWHAAANRLASRDPGWVNELNADPRTRTAAGFGTSVVQRNQEDYLHRAWQQVGDVIEANRRIRQAQLALSAGFQTLRKNLEPLRAAEVVAVTRAVHARVLGSPQTIRELVTHSRLPDAAVEPAFRALLRPRGRIARQALPEANRRPTEMVSRLNEGKVTAANPKVAPPGQIGLEQLAHAVLPDFIPDFLRSLLQQPALLWGLIALIVVALFIAGGWLLGLVAAVAAAAAVPAILRLMRQTDAATGLQPQALTPAAAAETPPRPSFVITNPGETIPAIPATSAADSIEAAHFRRAAVDLHARLSRPEVVEPAKVPLDLTIVARKLTTALNPKRALPARLKATLGIAPELAPLKPVETIAPVMAHPTFKDPMYKPLRDISADHLVPNLNQIPNNTVSLMESNDRYIESYMVGLNHEMARELLWREYPTDQRGSYFRQFWEAADSVNRDPSLTAAEQELKLRDIKPLHEWPRTSHLGTHPNRDLPTGAEPGDARLVLVVRGDLLKKYPTTVVYAQRARWDTDPHTGQDIRVLEESDPANNLLAPIFKAEVPPDIHFFGFNLTQSQARGSRNRNEDPGWFVVLQERPGEPRFAMDVTDVSTPPPVTRWRELTWNHIGDPESIQVLDLTVAPAANIAASEADHAVVWGSNAADMAYILLQDPVMVAFHASDMLD